MNLTPADFDYPLPGELIAQSPLPQRDQSRLMRLRRSSGRIEHHVFAELPALLRPGDLLVVNDTRVVPAKFRCRRETGGKVEGLFLLQRPDGRWEVLLKNAGQCKAGDSLAFAGDEARSLALQDSLGQGRWLVQPTPPGSAEEILGAVGATPLPPYIRRTDKAPDGEDRLRYQTVYAARPGAVAAPTAGLHFTDAVLAELTRRHIQTARLTLHVGLGTFAPVKEEDLARHKMHAEWYDLPAETAEALNAARRDGRRIVAVGTTSVRVLETAVRKWGQASPGEASPHFRPAQGWTDIFLYPPAEFRAVDALVTNFHLPRSTLLMLVAAFCRPGGEAGVRMILDAYAEAVKHRYRFYSYGDAMLIE